MNNKGFMGLVNFEDTPLEVKYTDGILEIAGKSIAQGVVEGALVVGALVVGALAIGSGLISAFKGK